MTTLGNQKLSQFGVLIRKFRLDNGLLLKDMADVLAVNTSWLSLVETGRKPVPENLISKLSSIYNMSECFIEELNKAAINSKNFQKLQNINLDRRDVAAALARRFNELDDNEIETFRSILSKEK